MFRIVSPSILRLVPFPLPTIHLYDRAALIGVFDCVPDARQRDPLGKLLIARNDRTVQAKARYGDLTVVKFPFTANGKAQGPGDPGGFVKLVTAGEQRELVGGHLIGHDVSELLPGLTLAQAYDLTAHDAARNIYVHPTMGEAVKETLHGLVGEMINL